MCGIGRDTNVSQYHGILDSNRDFTVIKFYCPFEGDWMGFGLR